MNYEELKDKRIAVLLSGGVDSSVVVYEFAQLGLKPDCFYIKIGPEEKEEWDCSSEEDLEMATSVARRFGCKLEVIDCHQEYWNQVTKYTMDKVKAGFTPNPDVMCNRLIKFGAFDEKRGHDYDLIATGHYAQTKWIDGRKWLCTSPDPVKDQTDFLAQIYDWQLKKAIFPIGHYEKNEVREIAERETLINARRKDSQGICFLGNIDYNEYVRRYLGEQPGDVIELETGKKIGSHKGLWFHTIGQRKGLGFGGGPWFVVKKDVENNVLFVSHGYDPETAYKKDFKVHDLHWLTEKPQSPLVSNSDDGRNAVAGNHLTEEPLPIADNWIPITFKIRHTPEFHKGYLEFVPNAVTSSSESESVAQVCPEEPNSTKFAGTSCAIVHSLSKIHGVAPGQFCVIYDEEHNRCFGSAEITV
ncbi:tRNA 2-thiouridine(34) synthase MnmA [Prevotella sp. HUN102]|uniref:tRNA 2-thiouridine(34) synthase MnmA n=1 Tax=Prevotella sp. HUN102 TaxID=1392486 RepID=UPI00048C42F0|nr:tRNA 2-thiouridine(34) synthase MnmA [Prevotella sp. HUN102]